MILLKGIILSYTGKREISSTGTPITNRTNTNIPLSSPSKSRSQDSTTFHLSPPADGSQQGQAAPSVREECDERDESCDGPRPGRGGGEPRGGAHGRRGSRGEAAQEGVLVLELPAGRRGRDEREEHRGEEDEGGLCGGGHGDEKGRALELLLGRSADGSFFPSRRLLGARCCARVGFASAVWGCEGWSGGFIAGTRGLAVAAGSFGNVRIRRGRGPGVPVCPDAWSLGVD
jgi:hypothetical protein